MEYSKDMVNEIRPLWILWSFAPLKFKALALVAEQMVGRGPPIIISCAYNEEIYNAKAVVGFYDFF